MVNHNIALKSAMEIEGALGVALVDSSSGMALGTAGSPMDVDLDVAAAGNSNVVQAKLRTIRDLGLQQSIEDILITLDKQYHIIRPLARQEGIFLYLMLDRARVSEHDAQHHRRSSGKARTRCASSSRSTFEVLSTS